MPMIRNGKESMRDDSFSNFFEVESILIHSSMKVCEFFMISC